MWVRPAEPRRRSMPAPSRRQTGQLSLSILPRGTITGYEQYGFEGLKLADQLSLILPAAILLLAIVTVVVVKRSKKKRKPRRRSDDDEPRERREREVSPPPRRTVSSGVIDLSRKRS